MHFELNNERTTLGHMPDMHVTWAWFPISHSHSGLVECSPGGLKTFMVEQECSQDTSSTTSLGSFVKPLFGNCWWCANFLSTPESKSLKQTSRLLSICKSQRHISPIITLFQLLLFPSFPFPTSHYIITLFQDL